MQIAKSYGAEVTGVDGPDKLALLRSIGADHVIDYTQEDFTENGRRYDVILDIVAHRSIFKSKRSLAQGGIYVLAGGSWTALWQTVLLGPLISRIGRGRVALLAAGPSREVLTHLAELLEAGTIAPVIDRCYPLEEAAAAIRRLGENQARGKIIITP